VLPEEERPFWPGPPNPAIMTIKGGPENGTVIVWNTDQRPFLFLRADTTDPAWPILDGWRGVYNENAPLVEFRYGWQMPGGERFPLSGDRVALVNTLAHFYDRACGPRPRPDPRATIARIRAIMGQAGLKRK